MIVVKAKTQGTYYWVRSTGDIINIDEMNIEHLRNAFKKLIAFHHIKKPGLSVILCDIRTSKERTKILTAPNAKLKWQKEIK